MRTDNNLILPLVPTIFFKNVTNQAAVNGCARWGHYTTFVCFVETENQWHDDGRRQPSDEHFSKWVHLKFETMNVRIRVVYALWIFENRKEKSDEDNATGDRKGSDVEAGKCPIVCHIAGQRRVRGRFGSNCRKRRTHNCMIHANTILRAFRSVVCSPLAARNEGISEQHVPLANNSNAPIATTASLNAILWLGRSVRIVLRIGFVTRLFSMNKHWLGISCWNSPQSHSPWNNWTVLYVNNCRQ